MASLAPTSLLRSWKEICESSNYRGRWVALDRVRYDGASSCPTEGEVVDVDDDLAALCKRMRDSERTACAIVFCEPSGTRGGHGRTTQNRV